MENRLFTEALELFQKADMETAQRWITENFGEDADLNIVKCKQCGEIIAVTLYIFAKAFTGGDKRVNLEVYKHIRDHRDHANSIVGIAYDVELPIGSTLFKALQSTAKKFNLSIDEALDKRIQYLEDKLI